MTTLAVRDPDESQQVTRWLADQAPSVDNYPATIPFVKVTSTGGACIVINDSETPFHSWERLARVACNPLIGVGAVSLVVSHHYGRGEFGLQTIEALGGAARETIVPLHACAAATWHRYGYNSEEDSGRQQRRTRPCSFSPRWSVS